MKYTESNLKNRRKRELYRHYQIDRKTLSKWVRHFCGHLISPAEFSRCRKISEDLFRKILQTLGESGAPMRKQQIAERAFSNYQTVRDSIKCFPSKFGVGMEVYDQLSVFPPAVAGRIILALE